jgi:hypothetical protein
MARALKFERQIGTAGLALYVAFGNKSRSEAIRLLPDWS